MSLSLHLKCLKAAYSWFLIFYSNLNICLLIEILSLFKFGVIIDMIKFKSTHILFVLYLSSVIFSHFVFLIKLILLFFLSIFFICYLPNRYVSFSISVNIILYNLSLSLSTKN